MEVQRGMNDFIAIKDVYEGNTQKWFSMKTSKQNVYFP